MTAGDYYSRANGLTWHDYFNEYECRALSLTELSSQLRSVHRYSLTAAVINPHSESAYRMAQEACRYGIIKEGDVVDLVEVGRRPEPHASWYTDLRFILDDCKVDTTRFGWANVEDRMMITGQVYDFVVYGAEIAEEGVVFEVLSRHASLSLVNFHRELPAFKRIVDRANPKMGPVFTKSFESDHCIPMLHEDDPRSSGNWLRHARVCVAFRRAGCSEARCPASLACDILGLPPAPPQQRQSVEKQ